MLIEIRKSAEKQEKRPDLRRLDVILPESNITMQHRKVKDFFRAHRSLA
jgi:hypothetical protein